MVRIRRPKGKTRRPKNETAAPVESTVASCTQKLDCESIVPVDAQAATVALAGPDVHLSYYTELKPSNNDCLPLIPVPADTDFGDALATLPDHTFVPEPSSVIREGYKRDATILLFVLVLMLLSIIISTAAIYLIIYTERLRTALFDDPNTRVLG